MTAAKTSASGDLIWDLLTEAESKIADGEFDGYFGLRARLPCRQASDRKRFRSRFIPYYRLNIGGLTDAFKSEYFDRLFKCRPVGDPDPHTPLLRRLYEFPRRQGDHVLQASFVTKLVSIHDETRPIFDRHVSGFFGVGVPRVGSTDFRIAGFVANLRHIQNQYESWARDPRFARLRKSLIAKQPRMADCHPTRVCDFLVWAAGAKLERQRD